MILTPISEGLRTHGYFAWLLQLPVGYCHRGREHWAVIPLDHQSSRRILFCPWYVTETPATYGNTINYPNQWLLSLTVHLPAWRFQSNQSYHCSYKLIDLLLYPFDSKNSNPVKPKIVQIRLTSSSSRLLRVMVMEANCISILCSWTHVF